MTGTRLGMAAGALLRDHDRPAADPRHSIQLVMVQVRVTPQVPRSRWWPRLRRETIPALDLETSGSLDHPTYITNGRTQRPVRAQTGGSRTMFGAFKLVAAGVSVALVSVFLASGVLRLSGPDVPGSASPASPSAPSIGWTTERVALVAEDFRLEVNDLVFGDDVWPQTLNSDPGRSDYWTLEVVWFEHDVEQRLNMYFGSDGSDWWVDEIRTYDGHERGEWVYAYGPFFKTPLGEAFEGDVTVDLLGEGRPGDPDDIIPAVLSFSSMRLAVSPGTGPTPGPVEVAPELSPVPTTAAGEPAATSAEVEEMSAEARELEAALTDAIGDPEAGAECLTVEQAHAVAESVLSELGLGGWSIRAASNVHEDGCALASVSDDDQAIVLMSRMHPDVGIVIEDFRELSLDECLDATTAVDTLTANLNEIGRTDFVIEVSGMLGGPIGMEEEIQAHADAGCVFYVGVGAEADGTPIYFLHGE